MVSEHIGSFPKLRVATSPYSWQICFAGSDMPSPKMLYSSSEVGVTAPSCLPLLYGEIGSMISSDPVFSRTWPSLASYHSSCNIRIRFSSSRTLRISFVIESKTAFYPTRLCPTCSIFLMGFLGMPCISRSSVRSTAMRVASILPFCARDGWSLSTNSRSWA